MKKLLHFFVSSFFIALILFSQACKKSTESPTSGNTATIKLNGAQPKIDSVITRTFSTNGIINEVGITAYIHSNSPATCDIFLLFDPSNPSFSSGRVISLSAPPLYARLNYRPDANTSYTILSYSNGSVTLTKNDPTNRRIEGTLANCLVSNNNNTSDQITINGTFAITYPAP